MDLEARQRGQGSQVRLLPLGLSGIAGTGIESGGEVADLIDCVQREESFGQFTQIQPSERCVLEGAVVEVEAVDVDVGNQLPLSYKDRDRP